MCLATWKSSILRAKTGDYLTKKRHLTKRLATEKLTFFFLFFMLGKPLDNEKVEQKKLFTLKKIKKYGEKHGKSENVRKV